MDRGAILRGAREKERPFVAFYIRERQLSAGDFEALASKGRIMSCRTRWLGYALLIALPAACRADIYRWDNGQLIPGTEGITPGPRVELNDRELRFAELMQANLAGASFIATDLSNARLSGANVTNATFREANLTDVDLAGADVTGADLRRANLESATLHGAKLNGAVLAGAFLRSTTSRGFTKEQLYSTASYENKNLQNIGLPQNNLTGWDFSGQNLAGAGLYATTLTNAKFDGAIVAGASLSETTSRGFTKEQLYSTGSYQVKDLHEINLSDNDLTGWDFTGQNLTYATMIRTTLDRANLEGSVVYGVNFGETTITKEQLYSTASYRAKSLGHIDLFASDLTGWDLSGQYLRGAWLNLKGSTIFTDAIITGASLTGLNAQQLYSTASYQAKNLHGIRVSGSSFRGWNFSGQNLTHASFGEADFTNADFTGADARASGLSDERIAGAITRNFISLWGTVRGLSIGDGERLTIVDHDGFVSVGYYVPPFPVSVLDGASIAPGGILGLVFEGDSWDSQISFEAGIPVTLGGVLELTFADGVDLATQVGRTLRLFDWTGVSPSGEFEIRSPYVWDRTNLYTTGEVTLVAVPEPSAVSIVLVGMTMLLAAGYRASSRSRAR
jgi:uncharacterized protein YjbI with pentapeptide repeats